MEMDLKHKDDNKEVSLGTSKVCREMKLNEVDEHLFCDLTVALFLRVLRSTTWTLVSRLHGANSMKFQSKKCFRRLSATNSIGRWLLSRNGNSMERLLTHEFYNFRNHLGLG
jgi:hypothetical protein